MPKPKCEECGKICANNTGLAAHRRSHAPRGAIVSAQVDDGHLKIKTLTVSASPAVLSEGTTAPEIDQLRELLNETIQAETEIIPLAKMLVYMVETQEAIEARIVQIIQNPERRK